MASNLDGFERGLGKFMEDAASHDVCVLLPLSETVSLGIPVVGSTSGESPVVQVLACRRIIGMCLVTVRIGSWARLVFGHLQQGCTLRFSTNAVISLFAGVETANAKIPTAYKADANPTIVCDSVQGRSKTTSLFLLLNVIRRGSSKRLEVMAFWYASLSFTMGPLA